jgi:acyl-CoA thioester hydrolase
MRRHIFPVRVYYEDTDFSGAVYHANYLRFMERARTEMLRALDVNQGARMAGDEAEVFGFVVRNMTIDFLKPARMDDMLTVETTPQEIRAASLELTHRILRGDDLIVTAHVRIACAIDGRAARIPKTVREKLKRGLPDA